MTALPPALLRHCVPPAARPCAGRDAVAPTCTVRHRVPPAARRPPPAARRPPPAARRPPPAARRPPPAARRSPPSPSGRWWRYCSYFSAAVSRSRPGSASGGTWWRSHSYASAAASCWPLGSVPGGTLAALRLVRFHHRVPLAARLGVGWDLVALSLVCLRRCVPLAARLLAGWDVTCSLSYVSVTVSRWPLGSVPGGTWGAPTRTSPPLRPARRPAPCRVGRGAELLGRCRRPRRVDPATCSDLHPCVIGPHWQGFSTLPPV